MFSFKNKQQKQQQPPTSPGDNTYTRQLHPTKYGRVQTIDSKLDEVSSNNNLLLTSNEDGSLVESELSTTDQHQHYSSVVAPHTPAADIVDELDVLGDTTNDKLTKEDLLKLAAKEEGAVKVKKEDLLDNISIFSVKDDSFSVTDGESTDESAKSGSTRSSKSGSTKSSRSGKSKSSRSVKSRLSIRSNKAKSTLQSVKESNVMSDKQANDAYNKLWHNSNNSGQKESSAAEEGGESTAASQTSRSSKQSQKKKGSAADAQSLDNTFNEEDGQSVYSSSYISVYSAAVTERSCDGSFMSKKSVVKSSKNEDGNAKEKKEIDTEKEDGLKEEEEKKEKVPVAKVMVDTHSALNEEKSPSSEESKVEQQKKALPLFNKSKKNLKSKSFFGKLSNNKKNASSDDVEDSAPLPVHINEISDEEVEITYGTVGSSLPIEKKSTKEDSMARVSSNTTAPTVESKEEDEELEKVVPFIVSHSYYGAGAEDDDDGGFFGKLLSCTGVPQCNGGVDGEFDNDMLAEQVKQTTAVGAVKDDAEDDDEAYLNVEIFEDGEHTRIGYFMESVDEDDDQANDTSDDRSINMRVRSKVILKTKVTGSEDDVVNNIATKLQQQEQQKDTTTGNSSIDNSLKSKKKNVLRMKLLKRLNKKDTVTN